MVPFRWPNSETQARLCTLPALLLLTASCAGSIEKRAETHWEEVRDTRAAVAKSSSADAAETPSPLEEVLRESEARNPALESAFDSWTASLEGIDIAQSLPNPKLGYGYFLESVETRVGPQRQKFSVSQTIPLFGKRGLRGNIAASSAEESGAKYEAQRRKLLFDTTRLWLDYYYVQRSLRTVEENATYLRGLAEVVQSRYETGATPHSSLVRTQIELAKVEDQAVRLRQKRVPIAAALNGKLDRASQEPIRLPDSLPATLLTIPAAAEEWIDRRFGTESEAMNVGGTTAPSGNVSRSGTAGGSGSGESDPTLNDLTPGGNSISPGALLSSHPKLQAARARLERAQAATSLARKTSLPDLTLGAEYIETGDSEMPTVADRGKDAAIAKATIDLPLWFGRNDAHKDQARAQLAAAESDLAEARNAVHADFERVVFELADAQRRTALYEEELLPLAQQTFEVVTQQFATGTSSFLDVIESQRSLLDLELSLDRARVDLALAIAGWFQLVGDNEQRTQVEAGPRSGRDNDEGDAR